FKKVLYSLAFVSCSSSAMVSLKLLFDEAFVPICRCSGSCKCGRRSPSDFHNPAKVRDFRFGLFQCVLLVFCGLSLAGFLLSSCWKPMRLEIADRLPEVLHYIIGISFVKSISMLMLLHALPEIRSAAFI